MTENAYKIAAQIRKAARLVAVARESKMSADDAERATESQRSLVAQIAGVQDPSDETWAIVVDLLRPNGLRRYWTVTFDFEGGEQIQIDTMAFSKLAAINRAADGLDVRDRTRRWTVEANEVL